MSGATAKHAEIIVKTMLTLLWSKFSIFSKLVGKIGAFLLSVRAVVARARVVVPVAGVMLS